MQPAQGAVSLGEGRTRFRVWAPNAARVDVCFDDGRAHALEGEERGYFSTVVPDTPPGARYRYRLDGGEELLPDPASRWQPDGVHGSSAVLDPSAFAWSDDGWRGISLEDYVVYELHVGTFTDAGTFEAAVPHLAALRDLGVTAIEIMPVAQFPGARNWGYDGVLPYAAQDSYGGPHGLQRLVDACHQHGLAAILDVVYNHMGPEGNRLADFGPYFTDHYRTPWGAAVNVDQAGSDEVRRFFIDNALQWLLDFHFDALRLDAIHGIYDASASPFLRELADEVHAASAAAGRPLLLIAESETNDKRVVAPAQVNGLGMDAQWSDDFHHAVHALLTGERAGYYIDFGDREHVRRALADGFVYAGEFSPYRNRRHGSSAREIEPHRLIVCIQNHDQIGNRLNGDRLSVLVPHEKLKLGAALMLLCANTPMLFMGEEYGETAPFLYFVSHTDPELIEAVRRGRAQEFAAFEWAEEPPDPQDEQTFLRSKLNRALLDQPQHRDLYETYRALLRVRREVPALRARDREVSLDGTVLTVRSAAGSSRASAVFNLSAEPARAPVGGRLVLGDADLGPWAFAVTVGD